MRLPLLTALSIAVLAVSCTMTVPAVAYDAKADEVFAGSAKLSMANSTGGYRMQSEREEEKRQLVGSLTYTSQPGSKTQGSLSGRIDDGTTFQGEWSGSGVTGFGEAFTRDGNLIAFAFGLQDSDVNAWVEQRRKERQSLLARGREHAAANKEPPASQQPPPSEPSPAPSGSEDEFTFVHAGSGFLVTPDGLILTCHHVIKAADRVEVVLPTGEVMEAKVDGISPTVDLAALKIDGLDLPYLPLGNSRSIALGQEVFTLGYPMSQVLGSDVKYSEGAVSSLSGIQGDRSIFQISNPIQPGCSGSPLLTFDGRVIGIVIASIAEAPFFEATGSLPQNINWAIRIETGNFLLPSELPPATDSASRAEAIRRAEQATVRVRAYAR